MARPCAATTTKQLNNLAMLNIVGAKRQAINQIILIPYMVHQLHFLGGSYMHIEIMPNANGNVLNSVLIVLRVFWSGEITYLETNL